MRKQNLTSFSKANESTRDEEPGHSKTTAQKVEKPKICRRSLRSCVVPIRRILFEPEPVNEQQQPVYSRRRLQQIETIRRSVSDCIVPTKRMVFEPNLVDEQPSNSKTIEQNMQTPGTVQTLAISDLVVPTCSEQSSNTLRTEKIVPTSEADPR